MSVGGGKAVTLASDDGPGAEDTVWLVIAGVVVRPQMAPSSELLPPQQRVGRLLFYKEQGRRICEEMVGVKGREGHGCVLGHETLRGPLLRGRPVV